MMHTQIIRDEQDRLIIGLLYNQDYSFFDAESKRFILRVKNLGKLLYISPNSDDKQFCIFEKAGCYVDFEAARSRNETVVISREQDPDEQMIIFNHVLEKVWLSETIQWMDIQKTQGFLTYNFDSQLGNIFEVRPDT